MRPGYLASGIATAISM